jgi:hypothetical protein
MKKKPLEQIVGEIVSMIEYMALRASEEPGCKTEKFLRELNEKLDDMTDWAALHDEEEGE